jgi:hypothetical protein
MIPHNQHEGSTTACNGWCDKSTIKETTIYVLSQNDDKYDNHDRFRSSNILYDETMSNCFLTTTQRSIQQSSTDNEWFLKECARFHMGATVDINFPVASHQATCNPLNDETLGGNHMGIINNVQGAIQWPMHPNPHHIQDCGTWCNWPNMQHTKNLRDAPVDQCTIGMSVGCYIWEKILNNKIYLMHDIPCTSPRDHILK